MGKVKEEVVSSGEGRRIHGSFFIGLFLCCSSMFMLLSFLTADISLDPVIGSEYCSTGLIGSWIAYGSVVSFGEMSSYFITLLVFLWGALVMKEGRFLCTWVHVLGGMLMLMAISLISGLAGSGGFYSGGLLCEIVLPYANLYGGSIGVFMMSGVIFVTGMMLSFGTGIFVLAERAGELLVSLFLGSARTAFKTCKSGSEKFAPKFKGAMLTAGAGVMNPVLDAKKSLTTSINERAARASASAVNAAGTAEAKKEKVRVEPRFTPPTVDEEVVEAEVIVEKPEQEQAAEVADITARFNASFTEEAANVEETTGAGDDDWGSAAVGNDSKTGYNNNATAENTTDFAGGWAEAEDAQNDFDQEELAIQQAAPAAREAEEEVAGENPYEKMAAENAAKKIAAEKLAAQQSLADESKSQHGPQPYQLPELELLDPVPERKGGNPAALAKRAKILENLLADFKIQGQVVHIERGPRITQFEISLAPGIKLSRVSGLQDNIAMVLKAPSIRIIAPIPGKDTIGIEIPNINQELVTLREVVEAVDVEDRKQALPLCLAKDVSGKPIIADLAKMPHLLIAGATGSGKSVCINSIIMSFLCCLRYDECKLIMVDPKVVELSRFRDIPHLMSPVITDMQKAVGVLEWACQEMDQRYEKLSMVRVNNLAKFNALSEREIEERVGSVYGEEELEHFPRKLPFIVIIIDELADLMMVAKKDVENHIARLAAKSRAVGIHLILATQRPSTDVITGLIKANMPSRIAFQVASKIDSRIILDQMGADSLLGQGDMLYLPPGVSKVMRSQGVFVSDDELFAVVDHCKSQRGPEYHTALEGPVIGGETGDNDISKYDEYFLEAAERIIESGRGSVSLLQRKLGIGYGRASRIVDQLAESGILGPFRDGKAREILIDMDELYARYFGGGANLGKGKYRQEEEGMIAGQRDDERAPF